MLLLWFILSFNVHLNADFLFSVFFISVHLELIICLRNFGSRNRCSSLVGGTLAEFFSHFQEKKWQRLGYVNFSRSRIVE